MAGRKPRPTQLKLLAGEKNRDRINLNEPVAPPGRPEPPEGLTAAGAAEWDRLCGELESLSVLTMVDRAILWGYLTVWERGRAAEAAMQREGRFPMNADGRRYKHPAMSVAEESSRQQRLLLVELGLTPSARSRIVMTPKQKPKTGIGKFLA